MNQPMDIILYKHTMNINILVLLSNINIVILFYDDLKLLDYNLHTSKYFIYFNF